MRSTAKKDRFSQFIWSENRKAFTNIQILVAVVVVVVVAIVAVAVCRLKFEWLFISIEMLD